MATQAAVLRKFDGENSEPRRAETARPNSYLLRALPNEDIFFHVKRVDNSRLVREADPRAKAECWSSIGAVCAIAAVLLTSLAPRVAGITAGYEIQALKQQRQRLLDDRRGLEVQEAQLRGSQRLHQLARDQKMIEPKPEQIVHFSAVAPDHTVASLASQNE
jgi:cell division protein FtsL